MTANRDFYRMPIWYADFSTFAFMTGFVRLTDDEITALSEGVTHGPQVRGVIHRMKRVMYFIPGNSFASVDCVAPTDTERFHHKRGAVHSARSAWKYLALSEKVQRSAQAGEVGYVCLRPFRRITRAREFRLFVYQRQLKAMSQYWLVRHFRRLNSVVDKYWKLANRFVEQIAPLLPDDNIVIDIYFTAEDEILLLDFNIWGECRPLMLHTWERDWDETVGPVLMPPPTKISGDVNVSF